MDIKQGINWKQALQVGIILFLVLFIFGNHCPIEEVIGIPCPGCNMFSALYWFFSGHWNLAYFYHPGVFLLIPYFVFMGFCYLKKGNQLYTIKACKWVTIVFFTILIIIYIWRMIVVFPNYPMQYNTSAILYRIIQILKL